MLKLCKLHFNATAFSLEHHDPGRFVRGPWKPASASHITVIFLAYRIILMLLFVVPLIWSLVIYSPKEKWFIYFTYWAFFMCSAQATFGLFFVARAFLRQRTTNSCSLTCDTQGSGDRMPLSYKIYWLAYNISIPMAFLASTLYWTLAYDPNLTHPDGTSLTENAYTHGANVVLSIVELTVGGPPSKFLHFIHPILFGAFYIFFTVIYWIAGGTGVDDKWIYPVLNWQENRDITATVIFSSAVLIIVFHAFTCFLAAIRNHFAHKKQRKTLGSAQLPTSTVGKFNTSFVVNTA